MPCATRPPAGLAPVADALPVEDQVVVLAARIVVTEDLDELAVAGRARVGDDDPIRRGLRLAGAPQADVHSQSQMFLRERCAREKHNYTGRRARSISSACSWSRVARRYARDDVPRAGPSRGRGRSRSPGSPRCCSGTSPTTLWAGQAAMRPMPFASISRAPPYVTPPAVSRFVRSPTMISPGPAPCWRRAAGTGHEKVRRVAGACHGRSGMHAEPNPERRP